MVIFIQTRWASIDNKSSFFNFLKVTISFVDRLFSALSELTHWVIRLTDFSVDFDMPNYRNKNLNTQTFFSQIASVPAQIIRRKLIKQTKRKLVLGRLRMSTNLLNYMIVWSNTSEHNLSSIQAVQNFAARIVSNSKKYDHNSPILAAPCATQAWWAVSK